MKNVNGMCVDCYKSTADRAREMAEKTGKTDHQELLTLISQEDAQQQDEIAKITLTTETAPNLKILERLDIVTAECAYGMNVFKDLFASTRDFFGGRSATIQNTMRDSKNTVLYELRREAHWLGANAVVGVDLDYVEIGSGSSSSMILLVASGTAVKADL
ncbi:MAG: YbjQ family protein [Paracoccus sp. (in: a-proteobacteria)]|uniref:YbjQ family protein n=1 Tax=Paracoccus sp. TaxID=267 RepID=UPI0026E02F88|nr:YbjQ family protein [Paracoccus sp. (in: a-proteobacteria)]MDO5621918.1 YbjQ family protein [Paracoccus sp. (in: a-proteobacteria)]